MSEKERLYEISNDAARLMELLIKLDELKTLAVRLERHNFRSKALFLMHKTISEIVDEWGETPSR